MDDPREAPGLSFGGPDGRVVRRRAAIAAEPDPAPTVSIDPPDGGRDRAGSDRGDGDTDEVPTDAPAGRRRPSLAARAEPPRRAELPRRAERSGWGPRTSALAPHAGLLVVAILVLAALLVALLIALVGSRQPSVFGTPDSAVIDTFGGDDGSALGDLPGGGTWETVGEWRVVAGAAFLSGAPAGGGRGFAVVPGSSSRQPVAATLYGLADDGGLVARYQGPGDYIALTPVAALGTWRLDVVVGGEVVSTQALGLVGVEEGMRAELVVRGTQAWAIIDGQVRGSADVGGAPSSGQVGLIAGLESGGSTRFDDVAREVP